MPQNFDLLTMSQNMDILTKTNFEVNKTIIKMARAVKQTDESINEVEGRLWSFDGTINTTNILGSKETTTGPKNPELYKTQWCRNILSKGICNFGDECWFAHDSSELRSAPQLNKTTNAVPLFNLASSALYNRRVGRF
ncbi:hypothetical protein ACQ4LE_005509 [Meloidogyne hapla]